MSKCIGLIRVSTEDQAKSGLGLEGQRAAIIEYAKAHSLVLETIIAEEGVGGGAPMEERKGLLEALSLLERGDTLLVAKRDRLGRDHFLAAWLEKESMVGGWSIISALEPGLNADDPASVLMRHIIDAFSVYEKQLISFRTRRALRARRDRGDSIGGPAPYGQKWVTVPLENGTQHHKLVPDPACEGTLHYIKTHRICNPPFSFQRIAHKLNWSRIPSPSGKKKWSAKVVRDVWNRLNKV